MVITCFNFVIAHPIITPNSVIGKFVYTKADDDEGDGLQYEQLPLPPACPAWARHGISQPPSVIGFVPILQIGKLSLEVEYHLQDHS